MNSDIQVGANVDFIGNLGANFSKSFGGTKFDASAQYKPFQQEGRISLNYSDNINSVSTSVYINDYNPGVLNSYTKHLDKNQQVGAGISVFKEDTNLYVKYKKDNIAVSAFGSIKNPFVGISARITL